MAETMNYLDYVNSNNTIPQEQTRYAPMSLYAKAMYDSFKGTGPFKNLHYYNVSEFNKIAFGDPNATLKSLNPNGEPVDPKYMSDSVAIYGGKYYALPNKNKGYYDITTGLYNNGTVPGYGKEQPILMRRVQQ